MKILREREVRRLTALSHSSIWRHERAKLFPARLQIGPNAVGWDSRDIERWLDSRPRGPKSSRPYTT